MQKNFVRYKNISTLKVSINKWRKWRKLSEWRIMHAGGKDGL